MREGLHAQGRVTRALAQPGIQEQQALLESLTYNRDRLPSSSLTPSFILRCFRSGGCVAHCGSTAQARRPAFAKRASLRGGRRRHRIPAGSACWLCLLAVWGAGCSMAALQRVAGEHVKRAHRSAADTQYDFAPQ